MAAHLRLGVNIDHVATIRNARGGDHPDPVRAAFAAAAAGADGITAHLREDRRHITDADIDRLMARLEIPLNLEMAATEEMLDIALRHRPHAACIVPEKREERTTEGGLDVAGNDNFLRDYVLKLKQAGIRVSMFIEPDMGQVAASKNTGAPVVELHAGAYCHALETNDRGKAKAELERLQKAAFEAAKLGLEVHAGHGITYKSVGALAAIPEIVELNIGHFIIGEAVFVGLENAVRNMRALMSQARNPKIMSA
jgi:pyridoxine 5-phosphate synthase